MEDKAKSLEKSLNEVREGVIKIGAKVDLILWGIGVLVVIVSIAVHVVLKGMGSGS